MRLTTRPVVAMCLALSAVACGEGQADGAPGSGFADGLVEGIRTAIIERDRSGLPLPEDALQIEIDQERLRPDDNFRIDLVDDLVIGDRGDDPDYLFGNLNHPYSSLASVAVDRDGRIYVLTRGGRAGARLPAVGANGESRLRNNRSGRDEHISVFRADGTFVHRFGRRGQGPGDLFLARWLILAGDDVLILHRRVMWSVWDTSGRYVHDRRLLPLVVNGRDPFFEKSSKLILAVRGLSDGSVVAMFTGVLGGDVRDRFGREKVTAGLFDGTGQVTRTYFEVLESNLPRIAVSATGEVYAGFVGSEGERLYVVAMKADGSTRWFTAIDWGEDFDPWVELRLDEAGHLFVVPAYRPASLEDLRRPVHVFTTEGQLIGSGYLNRSPEKRHWQVAQNGKVYGIRLSKTTREWEVVRYRLEMSRPADSARSDTASGGALDPAGSAPGLER